MAVVEIWTEWGLGEGWSDLKISQITQTASSPPPHTSRPPSADPSIKLAAFVC